MNAKETERDGVLSFRNSSVASKESAKMKPKKKHDDGSESSDFSENNYSSDSDYFPENENLMSQKTCARSSGHPLASSLLFYYPCNL
jgi:hypothetical protein